MQPTRDAPTMRVRPDARSFLARATVLLSLAAATFAVSGVAEAPCLEDDGGPQSSRPTPTLAPAAGAAVEVPLAHQHQHAIIVPRQQQQSSASGSGSSTVSIPQTAP